MPYLVKYELSGKKNQFRLSWAEDIKKAREVVEKMRKRYGKGQAKIYILKQRVV